MSKKYYVVFIILLLLTWRIYYAIPQVVGQYVLRQHPGYIGESLWANLDGMHYLSIAKIGYQTYQQAFFPLFPATMHILSLINISLLTSGYIVVYLSLFLTILLFWKLVGLENNSKIILWSVLFLLAFPTAFFFYAIYTESMFFCFVFGSLYFAKKQKYFLAGLLGLLASATRLVGVFLLPAILFDIYFSKEGKKKKFSKHLLFILFIPLGLIGYMIYLWINYQDPLFFIHSQPAFGAGRSGGEIILLPQVIWRYVKILLTIPLTNYDFYVAFLELFTFIIVLLLLLIAWKKNVYRGYVLFGLLSIILPTLSGTLSSIPRYSLSAFVIFILFARIKNTIIRITLFCFLLVFQFVLAMYFLQGYFVS